jgi:putative membrane protein
MITAYLLPGVTLTGFVPALILAVVLGAINAFVKPILLLITLPINILTLGLFTFVINALLIMLAASIVAGFSVSSFWWAMLFAVVLALVNWVIDGFSNKDSA